jgi:predicted Rossmann fold flavoprotein
MTFDTVVIGGGPAGTIAAGISAIEGNSTLLIDAEHSHEEILLRSFADESFLCGPLGRKDIQDALVEGSSLLQESLRAFSSRKLKTFMDGLGLPLAVDEHNRFIFSEKEKHALSRYLPAWLTRLAVDTALQERVSKITRKNDRYAVYTNKTTYGAHKIILATGGFMHPPALIEDLGLQTKNGSPALFPLGTESQNLPRGSLTARIFLWSKDGKKIAHTQGEAELSPAGIDGTVARNASLFSDQTDHITLDLCPQLDEGAVKNDIHQYLDRSPETLFELCQHFVPPFMADYLCVYLKDKISSPLTDLHKKERTEILFALKKLPLLWDRKYNTHHAVIYTGGIVRDEINETRLETRSHDNIFCAGDILAVTSRYGYSLYTAFATGYLAGRTTTRKHI